MIGILVSLWLFVAGLYLRADLYGDAGDAIEEAFKLVEVLEADKAAQHTNARGLFERGWGGGKSVDELWADVYAAVSKRKVSRVHACDTDHLTERGPRSSP